LFECCLHTGVVLPVEHSGAPIGRAHCCGVDASQLVFRNTAQLGKAAAAAGCAEALIRLVMPGGVGRVLRSTGECPATLLWRDPRHRLWSSCISRWVFRNTSWHVDMALSEKCPKALVDCTVYVLTCAVAATAAGAAASASPPPHTSAVVSPLAWGPYARLGSLFNQKVSAR